MFGNAIMYKHVHMCILSSSITPFLWSRLKIHKLNAYIKNYMIFIRNRQFHCDVKNDVLFTKCGSKQTATMFVFKILMITG